MTDEPLPEWTLRRLLESPEEELPPQVKADVERVLGAFQWPTIDPNDLPTVPPVDALSSLSSLSQQVEAAMVALLGGASIESAVTITATGEVTDDNDTLKAQGTVTKPGPSGPLAPFAGVAPWRFLLTLAEVLGGMEALKRAIADQDSRFILAGVLVTMAVIYGQGQK